MLKLRTNFHSLCCLSHSRLDTLAYCAQRTRTQAVLKQCAVYERSKLSDTRKSVGVTAGESRASKQVWQQAALVV